MTDLDPRLTFDSFVVGPANRLASAAARRAADSPGTSYNPLFLYSASGLGKSHILVAIANHSVKISPDRRVEYMALEGYLEDLTAALKSGGRDDFKDRYEGLDILLLDDVQFLAGQNEAQEMLLRTLDHLSAGGSQIVLASDRPPAEIDGLDARLLSRFSGGLIVDIGVPEYETRVAIIRRKAEEGGQVLAPGVAEALARYPVKNIRELGGALNKVFATQDLEERQISAEEVSRLLGGDDARPRGAAQDEFGLFLEDLTGAVAKSVAAQEEPWRKAIRETVNVVEREGFSTQRLRAYLGKGEPAGWEKIVEKFRADVQRLRDIDDELDRLDNPWPEAAQGLLKDPDRLDEAEALLASVRERQRPFPKLGDGPDLDGLEGYSKMALKAAQQLVAAEKPQYNPLYIWSHPSERARTLLGAAGRTFQAGAEPDARMAVTSVREFAEDFIRALGEGVAGAWRERWWTLDLLMVHGVEALSETERAQDEFFHLFEALKRRGARVLLAADRSPTGITKIDERLRSRFEGGLVLEVDAGEGSGELELVEVTEPAAEAGLWGDEPPSPARERVIPPLDEMQVGDRAGLFVDTSGVAEAPTTEEAPGAEPVAATAETSPASGSGWFPSAENVVLHWPRVEELLQEEFE